MQGLKEITFDEYTDIFNRVSKNVAKVRMNSTPPNYSDGIRFFKSSEGISYLGSDGYMGGLVRFNFANKENLSKQHQEQRIFKGGTFLDCYDGKLVELYKKQGFRVVARLPFNGDYAPKDWEEDEFLKYRPDVVFLSINQSIKIIYTNDYQEAYNHARGLSIFS